MIKRGDRAKSILKKVKPVIEEPEEIVKKVKIQDTGRQLVIQIPIRIANALNIKKGDMLVFKVPLKKKGEYSIKLDRDI